MKILIAEDNADNRNLLQRRLERQGWTVNTAVDGVEAIEVCQAYQPDIILMDMAMPRMSGMEATRLLKADPATAHVKVVAVTAHAMDANRVECMEAGCDDFVTKPIDFPALFSVIREIAEGSGGRIAA
jgi:two-component system, cell cycle response regulator DivK